MFDLLIQNVSVLMPDFSVKEGKNIYVKDSRIVKIADAAADDAKEAKEVISGRGKLVMPGLIDGHTHTCQQLLRGRTANEYPMVWTRILVPFESNLTPEDCYYSAKLACLEMIKSGTTAFAESGSTHMGDVAEAVKESGMRAAIARSTMDIGGAIPDSMKISAEKNMQLTQDLYEKYQGAGEGRLDIWFAIRQVMTCSPELIREILRENNVEQEEITWFVVHQANCRILESVAKHLGEPSWKFPMNLQHYGNTSSASIPILLDEMNRQGKLKKGDRILIAGFGAGLTWSGNILDWEKKERRQ